MLTVDIKRELPGFKLDVNFVLERGVMAVLGASGAGKTMTLQCIAGLLEPDSGSIDLNGKLLFDSAGGINLPSQKRRVGFVFQNYALFPHLTVIQNIGYGIRHLPRTQAEERVNQLMELMHVSPLGGRYPTQLSAGQQQRVAIARALAPEPEVLLFDEPFSALDVQLKERLELEFLALQEHFKGEMLLVTHDLAEGYKLGNKIAVFQAGSIIQCGSKQNVFFAPANRTVARLTGIRNLMKGLVTGIEEQTVGVFIPAWQKTLHVRRPAVQSLVLNQPVSIGIRSEHIRLEPGGEPNSLACRILQAAEGISSYAYRFQVSTDTESQHMLNAVVRKGGRPCLHIEECCEVYLPPEHLVLISG